jgi:hypothetical protein
MRFGADSTVLLDKQTTAVKCVGHQRQQSAGTGRHLIPPNLNAPPRKEPSTLRPKQDRTWMYKDTERRTSITWCTTSNGGAHSNKKHTCTHTDHHRALAPPVPQTNNVRTCCWGTKRCHRNWAARFSPHLIQKPMFSRRVPYTVLCF